MFCETVQIGAKRRRISGAIMSRSRKIAASAFCAAMWTLGPAPAAQAYPIDCAILLCMAGGFPASVECSRAKAEVIRRITPWPVEPPLQLWRCPMGMSREDAALAGIALPDLGPDGLTPEVRAYRDAMEIYHVRYHRTYDREGGYTSYDGTQVGRYAEDGSFSWRRGSFERGPEWLAETVGGQRVAIRECVSEHREGGCRRYEIVRYENRGRGPVTRGVAFRYQDHTGAIHNEFVRY